MSPLFENERVKQKARYEYMYVDDEIVDINLLNLSDDPETWLYTTSDDVLSFGLKSSPLYVQKDSINDANNFDSSDRSIDSRTYTRRKRCSLRPSLESVSEVNSGLIFNPTSNMSTRSSLGVLDLNSLSTTLEADTPHAILKCTPISGTQLEEQEDTKLLEFTSSFDNKKFKKFQLNSTYLTETPTQIPPSLPTAENKHNGLNNNSTFNDRFSIGTHGLSSTSPPINYSLNLSDSAVTKSTVHDQDILKKDFSDKLSKSEDEILNYKNETMIIASSTALTDEKCVPPVNKFATITKKPRDLNLTFSKSSLSSLRLPATNSVNNTLMNSKLNTTFSKSAVNRTFCKSTEGINGERESGTEDDQMSSASDSSFSSGTNLPRSVGDLQTIAKQQEESLKQVQQSTPKKNRVVGARNALFNGDDLVSPILNSGENGGSTSDLSERSSDTRSSSPSQSSHNNNRLPHPMSTVLHQDHELLMQANDRTMVKLPAARPGPSGLRMPTASSRLPTTVSRLPTARGRSVRPGGSALTTGIPRPASRLPAPRFRSTTSLQSKPH